MDVVYHRLADARALRERQTAPRAGVFRYVNLLSPPRHPQPDAAFIIMEPEDPPPMSGSNSICVATVLLETGIVAMVEPVTHLTLEAPGGLVKVKADCKNGKATSITVENVASFSDKLDAPLKIEGLGEIRVDTGFGGDSFVVVDAAALGFEIRPDEAGDLARMGVRITNAANQALGFQHPVLPGWDHISFCLFAGPLSQSDSGLTARSAVAIQPGKIDRSPTGTAVSARMAILSARGEMHVGDSFTATSIINSKFTGRIVAGTKIAGHPAIIPQITGSAWITGSTQHVLDPSDPWPAGYRLNDTWGN